eukprot:g31928.t1
MRLQIVLEYSSVAVVVGLQYLTVLSCYSCSSSAPFSTVIIPYHTMDGIPNVKMELRLLKNSTAIILANIVMDRCIRLLRTRPSMLFPIVGTSEGQEVEDPVTECGTETWVSEFGDEFSWNYSVEGGAVIN